GCREGCHDQYHGSGANQRTAVQMIITAQKEARTERRPVRASMPIKATPFWSVQMRSRHRGGLVLADVDLAALELDLAVLQREQGVIPADADVEARPELG